MRRLLPETIKIIEAEIADNYRLGRRKTAVALELLLAWYKESVGA